MTDGFFPTKSEAYLYGQSYVQYQFNDVEFYVEDEGKSNFYYRFLRKLFSGVRFENVFPLTGKKSIIDHSEEEYTLKKRVYILDMDFDDILGRIIFKPNIFYLDRYCIENYLLDIDSLINIIVDDYPQKFQIELRKCLTYSAIFDKCKLYLMRMSCAFKVISEYGLCIEYINIDTNSLFDSRMKSVVLDPKYLNKYIASVYSGMKHNLINSDVCLCMRQSRNAMFPRRSLDELIKVCPGKYLIKIAYTHLRRNSLVKQMDNQSFCIRLLNHLNMKPLEGLIRSIQTYIQS